MEDTEYEKAWAEEAPAEGEDKPLTSAVKAAGMDLTAAVDADRAAYEEAYNELDDEPGAKKKADEKGEKA